MVLQMLFVIMILITEAGLYTLYLRMKRRARYERERAEILEKECDTLSKEKAILRDEKQKAEERVEILLNYNGLLEKYVSGKVCDKSQ